MQSKNQILTTIYNSKELSNCLNLVKKESIKEDIRQEVFLSLLEKDEAFIIELQEKKQLKPYITTCIFNEIYNPRSKTRKKLGKESAFFFNNFEVEKIEIEDLKIEVNEKKDKAIDFFVNLPKEDYRKKILLALIKYGSFRKLSKEMEIPHTTLNFIINNFIKEIKQNS